MSWLERRDDRARLVAFALLASGLSVARGAGPLAAGLAVGALVAATSGLTARRARRRLTPILALLLPVALLTPLWAPPGATPLLADWPRGPTREGTALAGTIALRALALGLLAAGAFSVPLARTVEGLSRLRVPASLVRTTSMTVRFVEQLDEDLGRARVALGLRGFRPRADLRTSRTYAALTGALLVRSVATTERVETAMRLRGGGSDRPVFAPRPPFALPDALLVAVAAALAASLLVLDRGWPGG